MFVAPPRSASAKGAASEGKAAAKSAADCVPYVPKLSEMKCRT